MLAIFLFVNKIDIIKNSFFGSVGGRSGGESGEEGEAEGSDQEKNPTRPEGCHEGTSQEAQDDVGQWGPRSGDG